MIRILIRAGALVAAVALTLTGAATLAGTPATAATRELGGVMWSDTSGSAQSLLTVYSSGPCPAESRYVKATMFGKGLPAKGQTLVTPSELLLSRTNPMGLAVSNAFQIYGEDNNTALQGKYTVKIQCTDRFGMTSLGDFTTTMTWKTPGGQASKVAKATYVAKNTATVDVSDVFVPEGDLGIDGVPVPGLSDQPLPAPTATAGGAASPAATASAEGGDLPTVTASPPATVLADGSPIPAEPGATGDSTSRLIWLGLGAALLVVAGLFWFRPWRRSST